jgi:hypothetical protein
MASCEVNRKFRVSKRCTLDLAEAHGARTIIIVFSDIENYHFKGGAFDNRVRSQIVQSCRAASVPGPWAA